MESTLHDLGRILLNGLPTFFLVILLHFYLKFTFFKPLEKTLAARFDATEGARKAAEESMRNADRKIAEYQAALRAARGEVYGEQEKSNKELGEKNASMLLDARRAADARVQSAKAALESETLAARDTLASQSDALAEQIAQSILERRAA